MTDSAQSVSEAAATVREWLSPLATPPAEPVRVVGFSATTLATIRLGCWLRLRRDDAHIFQYRGVTVS